MSFYMILDLQGFDRVLAVREWFRGSNFWGVTSIRGSNVDATRYPFDCCDDWGGSDGVRVKHTTQPSVPSLLCDDTNLS